PPSMPLSFSLSLPDALPILFNLFLAGVSFFPEAAAKIRLDHLEGEHGSSTLFNFFLILTALSGPVYFVRSLALFKKLDINIFNKDRKSTRLNSSHVKNSYAV